MSILTIIGIIFTCIAGLVGFVLMVDALLFIKKQRRGKAGASENVQLKFRGIELCGGRPFAILTIGILLILFPALVAFRLLSPEPSYAQVVPEPKNIGKIPNFADPTYDGLSVIKDIRIVDLRWRRPVPESKRNEKYSPVTWTRYTHFKKIDPHREFVDFEFATTGVGIHARSLTHKAKLWEAVEPHYHGTKKNQLT